MSAITHGLASTYRSCGCRCDPCRAANTERTRIERQRREERLARGEVTVQHGKTSTYTNYRCRCDDCRKAWSDYLAGHRPYLEGFKARQVKAAARTFAAVLLAAVLAACSAADPDPCDAPDGTCPPTRCGETSVECG